MIFIRITVMKSALLNATLYQTKCTSWTPLSIETRSILTIQLCLTTKLKVKCKRKAQTKIKTTILKNRKRKKRTWRIYCSYCSQTITFIITRTEVLGTLLNLTVRLSICQSVALTIMESLTSILCSIELILPLINCPL